LRIGVQDVVEDVVKMELRIGVEDGVDGCS
jgi:hypothetical protein